MKVAISLPDPLSQAAERFAKARKLSRSRLFALALADYLARQDDAQLTARINAVVAETEGEYTGALAATQIERLRKVEW